MHRASLLRLVLACAAACLAAVGCKRAAPTPTEAVRQELGAAAPAVRSPALPSDPLLETRVLENGVMRAKSCSLRRYLQLRLMERLRDELGGVYAVQVSAKLLTPAHRGHELRLEMDCRPDQCDSLRQAALQVIMELARNGAAPEQVEALRNQLARGAQPAPTKTGFWLQELGNAYRRELDPAQIVATVTNGAHVSSAALQAYARRYLRTDQLVDALLLPAEQTNTAGAAAPAAAR